MLHGLQGVSNNRLLDCLLNSLLRLKYEETPKLRITDHLRWNLPEGIHSEFPWHDVIAIRFQVNVMGGDWAVCTTNHSRLIYNWPHIIFLGWFENTHNVTINIIYTNHNANAMCKLCWGLFLYTRCFTKRPSKIPKGLFWSQLIIKYHNTYNSGPCNRFTVHSIKYARGFEFLGLYWQLIILISWVLSTLNSDTLANLSMPCTNVNNGDHYRIQQSSLIIQIHVHSWTTG